MKTVWYIPLLLLLGACNRPSQPEVKPAEAQRTSEQSPTPPAKPDHRPALVCFGDSLTAGLGLDPGQTYPDLLQKALDQRGDPYRVVNLGVSGDTTQDGLDRLSLVLAEKPRIVILEFGANDGLRGQPVANTEKNLAQMIDALQKAGARVVLAGITLPPNYGPEYIRQFDAIYPALSKRYHLPLIPFLLEGVAGHADLMQQDGLHPNAKGVPLVVQNVLHTLEPVLPRN